ncbi:MAG: S8 family serine peptidase [Planctomycetota bacterium]
MGGFPTDALAAPPIAPLVVSGAVQHDTINWGGILQPVASGEWIVTFEPGYVAAQAHIDADPAAALLGELRRAGAPVESVRWTGRDRAVVVAPGVAPEAARAWMDHPALPIRHVEPNGLLAIPASNSASREVNDPRFSDQWGLRKIMAPEAWDITFGDEDIVVAVIDTGVDLDHPDLVGNLFVNPRDDAGDNWDNDGNGFVDDVTGWDFVNNDNTPQSDDATHHGAHVAGIIGAVGDNAEGIAGVAPNVRVLPLKTIRASGSGVWSDSADAIDYAVDLKTSYDATNGLRGGNVRVINMSIAGPGTSFTVTAAIQRARAAGILVVAASGNSSQNGGSFYPGSDPADNVISVAGSTSSDARVGNSNVDNDPDPARRNVDLFAPGASVISLSGTGGYRYMGGTSVASPHVAGMAALAFSYDPSLTYREVRTAIFEGVDAVPALSGLCRTGGRANALRMLEALGAGEEPNTPPVARDDTASVDAGASVAIDVLANDTDAEGDRLSVASFDASTSLGGFVSIDAQGRLVYVAPDDAAGLDTFGYTVTDGAATAQALVTVERVPAPIEAVVLWAESFDGLDAGATASFDDRVWGVRAFGDDALHGAWVGSYFFSFIGSTNAAPMELRTEAIDIGGAESVRIEADVAPWLTDAASQDDTFELFAAIDDEAPVSVARFDGAIPAGEGAVRVDGLQGQQLRLIVRAGTSGSGTNYTLERLAVVTESELTPNTAPIAQADSVRRLAGGVVSVDVLANDTDADGDPLSIAGVQPITVKGGLVTLSADGRVRYEPAEGFAGVDTFAYSVTDGRTNTKSDVTIDLSPSFRRGVLPWAVGFDGASDGDRFDNSSERWSASVAAAPGFNDGAAVQESTVVPVAEHGVLNGAYVLGAGSDADYPVEWRSQGIDIAGADRLVVSLELGSVGAVSNADRVRVSVRTDLGDETAIFDASGPVNAPIAYELTDLDASNLEVIVRAAVIAAGAGFTIDDLGVASVELPAGALWEESFADLTNNATSDDGVTAWSTDTSNAQQGISVAHGVRDGQYRLARTVSGGGDRDFYIEWASELVDISGAPVRVELDLADDGSLEEFGYAHDWIDIYAEVDGALRLIESIDGDVPAEAERVESDLFTGGALRVVVRAKTNGEAYLIDNVRVAAASARTQSGDLTAFPVVRSVSHSDTQHAEVQPGLVRVEGDAWVAFDLGEGFDAEADQALLFNARAEGAGGRVRIGFGSSAHGFADLGERVIDLDDGSTGPVAVAIEAVAGLGVRVRRVFFSFEPGAPDAVAEFEAPRLVGADLRGGNGDSGSAHRAGLAEAIRSFAAGRAEADLDRDGRVTSADLDRLFDAID